MGMTMTIGTDHGEQLHSAYLTLLLFVSYPHCSFRFIYSTYGWGREFAVNTLYLCLVSDSFRPSSCNPAAWVYELFQDFTFGNLSDSIEFECGLKAWLDCLNAWMLALWIEDLVCRIYRRENSENVAMQAEQVGCAMARCHGTEIIPYFYLD